MQQVLDTVLLLALPASGKSEVRRFLGLQTEEVCRGHFHMGPTVQLDDYPYVHFMRRVDDVMEEKGLKRIFFEAGDRGFFDPREWGTLIALINEDYEDLRALRKRDPEGSVKVLLHRFDAARKVVGADQVFKTMDPATVDALVAALDAEVREQTAEWNENIPSTLEDKTIVIEFARGGPDGSPMPIKDEHGYDYSLSVLSKSILERSSILYVWVTPEQSRAKNQERAKPGADGSILFHGVPMHVMLNDYGCDDMEYLLTTSGKKDHVKVVRDEVEYFLPAARMDNRGDLTTFVREDVSSWSEADETKLRDGLSGALTVLWEMGAARH